MYSVLHLQPVPSIHRTMLPMGRQEYQQEEKELRKMCQRIKMILVLYLQFVLSAHKAMSPTATQKTSIGATHDVPMNEEVTDPKSLDSNIDTQDNVAYGCMHTTTIVK